MRTLPLLAFWIGWQSHIVQALVLFASVAYLFPQVSQGSGRQGAWAQVPDWASSVRQSSDALAAFKRESAVLLTSLGYSLHDPETLVWEDEDERLFIDRLKQAHREGRFRDVVGLFGYGADRISRLRADRRQVTFVALASAHFRLGQHRTAARFCALLDPEVHLSGMKSDGSKPSPGQRKGLSQLPKICAHSALVSAIQLGKRIDPWKDYGSFLYVYMRYPAVRYSLPKAFVAALLTLRNGEAGSLPHTDFFKESQKENPLSLVLFAVSAAHSGRPDWALEHLERARKELRPLLHQSASEVSYVFALVEWLMGRVLADMGRREDARLAFERSCEAMLEMMEKEITAPLPRRRVLLTFGRLIFEAAREIESGGDTGRSLSVLLQLRDAASLFPAKSAAGQLFSEHLQMELELATLRLQMMFAHKLAPTGLGQLRERVLRLWADAAADQKRLESLGKMLAKAKEGSVADVLQVFRGVEEISIKYGDLSSLQRNTGRAVARLRLAESAFDALEMMAEQLQHGFAMLPPESHVLSQLVEEGRRGIDHHLRNMASLASATALSLRKSGSVSQFSVQAWGELLKGELLRFVRMRDEEQFIWGNARPGEELMRVEDLLSQRAAMFSPEDAGTTLVLREEADSLWLALDDHKEWNSVYGRSLASTVHVHHSSQYLLRLLLEQQTLMARKLPERRFETARLVMLGSERLLEGLTALREVLRFFRIDTALRDQQKEQLSRALNKAKVDRDNALKSLRRLVLDDANGIIVAARSAISRRRAQARLYLMQAVALGVITSAQAEKELGEQLLRLRDLSDALGQSAVRGGLN